MRVTVSVDVAPSAGPTHPRPGVVGGVFPRSSARPRQPRRAIDIAMIVFEGCACETPRQAHLPRLCKGKRGAARRANARN